MKFNKKNIKILFIFLAIIFFIIAIIISNMPEKSESVLNTCARIICKPDNLTIICENGINPYMVVDLC